MADNAVRSGVISDPMTLIEFLGREVKEFRVAANCVREAYGYRNLVHASMAPMQ
jgi:hypothetical protein